MFGGFGLLEVWVVVRGEILSVWIVGVGVFVVSVGVLGIHVEVWIVVGVGFVGIGVLVEVLVSVEAGFDRG